MCVFIYHQILLYDLRSDKPLLVKDHNYDLPIKKLQFLDCQGNDMIMSLDKHILKIWDRQTVSNALIHFPVC